MSARDDIASPLELFLLQLADDRNCTTDDLSVAMLRAAETFGLECYRRATDAAAENAPTQPRIRLPTPAESQTLPIARGLWEEPPDPDAVTPVTPPAKVLLPRKAWPYSSS